jgi:hypothetical protein
MFLWTLLFGEERPTDGSHFESSQQHLQQSHILHFGGWRSTTPEDKVFFALVQLFMAAHECDHRYLVGLCMSVL